MFGEKSCHHPTKHAKNGKSFQNQPSFFRRTPKKLQITCLFPIFVPWMSQLFQKQINGEIPPWRLPSRHSTPYEPGVNQEKKHDSNNWGCMRGDVPGDSIRDLFIPDRWRSLNHFKGSLNHRKKGTLNHQVYAWKTVAAVDFHQIYS